MKQLFNLDDDFEQFLSNAAEQQRMYPSDRVWRNIDAQLRTENEQRWPALGFASILIGAIFTTGVILVHPTKSLFSNAVAPKSTLVTVTTATHENNTAPNNAVFATQTAPETEAATLYNFGKSIPAAHSSAAKIDDESADKPTAQQADALYATGIASAKADGAEQASNLSNQSPNLNGAIAKLVAPAELAIDAAEFSNTLQNKPDYSNTHPGHATLPDETLGEAQLQKEQQLLAAQLELNRLAMATGKKRQRWNLQFYASPSISYRFVTEAKNTDPHFNNAAPLSPNVTHGAENFIRQRPDLGMEAGAAVLFNVTKNFRVKTGLQVNFRQYAIDAYETESTQSHIILNHGPSAGDTIYQMSSLSSNTPLGKSAQINNQFWQIAIPIGFDLKLTNGKQANIYVSGTVQPTYQINTNAYLLSSNYAHYIQQPNIIRRFNVNTAVEAFVSFKTGGLNWQAGPQIRYQLKSSAISAYPIHENLIDYGFKIGVVKSLH